MIREIIVTPQETGLIIRPMHDVLINSGPLADRRDCKHYHAALAGSNKNTVPQDTICWNS